MSLTSLFKRYGCVREGPDSQNSVTVLMISMVKITMLLANVIMSPDNIRRIGELIGYQCLCCVGIFQPDYS